MGETMTPNEYHAALTNLQAAFSKATPTAALIDKAYDLMADLESDYGVVGLKPEVPTETQLAFFALQRTLDDVQL